ncbi:hypothetical protein M426DRAFT_322855 [Hypoxylon sp. CI-4A]|nr:hypothetical protein M426DRAFT_322855 [Hypoxylon sp. CI-4A]
MADDDSSGNPFIRFKNHVDNTIHQGVQTVLGTSTAMDTQNKSSVKANATTNISYQTKSEQSLSSTGIPGAERETVDAGHVFSWAASSPYSPLNLQSLRQPRPKDVPDDFPDCFTFRDAFEDLLAVSAGKPLADVRRLAFTKHFEHSRYFPFGMSVGDWVSGIGRRGLWGAYFPLSPSATRELSLGLPSLWRTWQLEDMTFRPPQVIAWPRTPFPSRDNQLSWGFDDFVKGTERPLRADTETETATDEDREASSEGELYAAARSNFATDSSMRTEASQREAKPKPEWTREDDLTNPNETSTSQTTETPDGGKIVKTVQRHRRNGGTSITTTTRQYDADGNLIAQGKETTKTWSWQYPKTLSTTNDDDADGHTYTEKDGDDKSSGWFWTR